MTMKATGGTRGQIETIATGIFATAAIAIALTVMIEQYWSGDSLDQVGWEMEPEYAALAIARGQVIGRVDSPFQIAKFSDVQCPYCAAYVPVLDSVLDHYAGAVSIRYRHFPIVTIHEHARAGAIASECAGAQGRFEPFYREVTRNQDLVGSTLWTTFATRAGVPDTVAFSRCMVGDGAAEIVESDMDVGEQIGVSATPFIVLGNLAVVGVRPASELIAMIDEYVLDGGR